MEWKELSKIALKTTPLPENMTTNFWECLYQLFKQRFIQEQNAELKALADKEYDERAMD